MRDERNNCEWCHIQTRERTKSIHHDKRIIVVNVSTFARTCTMRLYERDVDAARQHRDQCRDRRMTMAETCHTIQRHTTHQSHYYSRHLTFEGNPRDLLFAIIVIIGEIRTVVLRSLAAA
jgi:hypothetical protein